jgi:hypothetical protein
MTARSHLELRRIGIGRHRDKNLNIVGGRTALELALGLDTLTQQHANTMLQTLIVYSTRECECRSMVDSIRIKGLTCTIRATTTPSNNVGGKTVRHQLKVTIRRNERDGSVGLEARQTHTLMELDIFQLHSLALTSYEHQQHWLFIRCTYCDRCFQRGPCR